MSQRHPKREGFFLVLVLVVIVVATLAVYSFTELMLAYDESAFLSGDLVQARTNVESGTEMLRLVLSQPPSVRIEMGGTYDNAGMFQAVSASMGADGASPSNFSVLAPGLTEDGSFGGLRFGLQNESARLNVNALPVIEANSTALTAAIALLDASLTGTDETTDPENIAVSLLMALPNMTEDVAEAILDFVDEDEDPRDYGVESDYYNTLQPPYSAADGPIHSVEELLLVAGVTPGLLFGADSNRNGLLDPDEQQRYGVSIDTPGALGWAAYLTVHGAEANRNGEGVLRVDVNQDDLELLYDELSTALGDDVYASFIVAYRIAGQSTSALSAATAATGGNTQTQSGTPGGAWSADLIDQLDLTGGGGTNLNQILDLVGATVTVGDGDQARTYESPFADDPISMALYMPVIMDALSTQGSDVMPGRINLNECPAELLYGNPLLTEEQVELILESRTTDSDDLNRRFETWPLVEGILTLDEMRTVMPLVTCGGDIYRAQIVGYYESSGVSSRAEVILDATTINPKVVTFRDLSHLGRGFDLSVLGVRNSMNLDTAP